ncbi:MAG: tRNA (adenosine(37)-N6)-threonylcarbamoyltransferase complex dimerization subunit type 1 TsaB [Alphaproteobacteria bacterium]|nr:tRNA (adenosine(37)-N6)-threonylcarbamoyltransferase complex dimerization subunit type 1 TsaB [Alphaproteobacteria bacterium]
MQCPREDRLCCETNTMLDPEADSRKCRNMDPSAKPTILALDAAGNACSAALWVREAVVEHRWEAMARGHAEALVPMAEEVVGLAGFGDVDLVAVSIGPGAYTGLRIAISVARGLALALDIPVMGINSLEVHLHQARNQKITGAIAVLLETKRTDFYVQAFGADDVPFDEPAVMDADAVAELLSRYRVCTAVGDAVARFAAEVECEANLALNPQDAGASVVATLAATKIATTGMADIRPPRPLYLRAPDTSPPAADRQILRG